MPIRFPGKWSGQPPEPDPVPPCFGSDIEFACARSIENDNTLEIIRSIVVCKIETVENAPGPDPDDPENETVTNVKHEYIVRVPFSATVIVDGSAVLVTRYRSETRSRVIPVKGLKNKRLVMLQTSVPYTETIEAPDGNEVAVQRVRIETRSQYIGPHESLVSENVQLESRVGTAGLQFFHPDGIELPVELAMKKLRQSQPVILIPTNNPDAAFYRRILQSGTIMIFDRHNLAE